MGFDLEEVRAAVARHGRVTRVVIADLRGSSPREVGAAMLVWEDGQSGTIGGGALEYQAAEAARAGHSGISQHALGPDLGQCCGGAVTLLSEVYGTGGQDAPTGDVIARAVAAAGEMPLAVHRMLAQARAQGIAPAPQLIGDWMVEPAHRATRQTWIWGAGHVGRALVQVLHPLPDVAITWVDTAPARFPDTVPPQVTVLPAARPGDVMRYAPRDATHLILTYSHALDLELCHRALDHGFGFAGVIGSATKIARFRKRLTTLGHTPEQIARLTCPIGDPALGKHPHMIALGVAAELLRPGATHETLRKDQRA